VSLKYFTLEEFACKETGHNEIDPEFVQWLDKVREEAGIPFVITSGYRHPSHSEEIKKKAPGSHTRGRACDIKVVGSRERFLIIQAAVKNGCTRMGLGKTFIHIDLDDIADKQVAWVY